MSDYNEMAARRLEEEYGEDISFPEFVGIHFTNGYVDKLSNTWSLSTAKHYFKTIGKSLKIIAAETIGTAVLLPAYPVALVLSPVVAGVLQWNKIRKNWPAYKAYKEDKDDDE